MGWYEYFCNFLGFSHRMMREDWLWKVMVSQITILYNLDEQKSIAIHTTLETLTLTGYNGKHSPQPRKMTGQLKTKTGQGNIRQRPSDTFSAGYSEKTVCVGGTGVSVESSGTDSAATLSLGMNSLFSSSVISIL